MFLDAIGEARDSVRRNTLRGIYDRVTLNAGQAGKEVEVLLLDERYERVPLPCHTRRRYCQADIAKSKWHEVRSAPITALYCATEPRTHPHARCAWMTACASKRCTPEQFPGERSRDCDAPVNHGCRAWRKHTSLSSRAGVVRGLHRIRNNARVVL